MSESLQRILYVDDEMINLSFFQLNFKKEYAILTTASPLQALEILKNSPDIRLLVTDFRMPGMNGMELIKEVKKIRPELACILITGFMLDEIDSFLDQKDLIYSYIQKPWKKEEVLDIFNDILEG